MSRRPRDRSRSRDRSRRNTHDYDEYDYNDTDERDRRASNRIEEAPNSTIMVRGLPLHVNESDIQDKLNLKGLVAKDIRLMRRKDTGTSRGFAFVEFSNLSDAIEWKESNRGTLIFDDTRAVLHFSVPKELDRFAERNLIQKYDWTCFKCGVNNFKRRDVCFKCGTTREKSMAIESDDDVSSSPTSCLLFRNLASFTTEKRVLTALGALTAVPIKSIKILKDSCHPPGRRQCFVELHSTLEATQLFTLISSLGNGIVVDDCQLTVSYAKRHSSRAQLTSKCTDAASVALAAAQWTNQSEQGVHSNSEILSHGDSSENLNFNEKLNDPNKSKSIRDLGTVSVNGIIYSKYSTPDPSRYQYDENSGFYHDASTGLYYDATSRYYYNGTTRSYLFWSSDHQTYLPASTNLNPGNPNVVEKIDKPSCSQGRGSNVSSPPRAKNENVHPDIQAQSLPLKSDESEKTEKLEKHDKVMIAKKIAKDMEKWAKTLNQRKDITKSSASIFNSEEDDTPSPPPASSVIGRFPSHLSFAARNASKGPIDPSPKSEPHLFGNSQPDSEDDSSRSPSQNDSQSSVPLEMKLTDLEKLLCLLCKRQFLSREQLMKHQQVSELHKTNLAKLSKFELSGGHSNELTYRDRAKERRLKYGQPGTPETVLPRSAESTKTSTSTPPPKGESLQENIGSKMLRAMGWSGQGLGRGEKGRTSIIEVQRRGSSHAGLGMKTTSTGAEESYKDAVRRAMRQRFQELSEKDGT
ncbi:RNA-binding protein 5-like [Brevipalpus obovatus]|uniref:RNA-binding protein 5-like n=1 Tax=Brevipalpus obovatus TaxID=246614 RepID=UPI003D9EB98A